MAHLPLEQREPLRNNFVFSARHFLHDASIYLDIVASYTLLILRGLHPLCGNLGSKWGPLLGTLETAASGRAPAYSVTLGIGDRYKRVVERRKDIGLSLANNPFLFLALDYFLLDVCHTVPFTYTLDALEPTVFFGPLRVRAFVLVR